MMSQVFDDASKVFAGDIASYVSLPYMTKYEFTQIIGLRIVHLSRGAPAFVDTPDTIKTNMQLRAVAVKELVEKRLPYIIKRTLPNGKPEYWPVSALGLETVRHLITSDM